MWVNRMAALCLAMSQGSAPSLLGAETGGEGGIVGGEAEGVGSGGKSTLNPRQRQAWQSIGVSTTACASLITITM